MRKLLSALLVAAVLAATKAAVAAEGGAPRLLFIGNSFTFAQGSAVRYFHASRVTDLNGTGLGGVPALFSVLAVQAGLNYDVFLETEPGSGLEFHLVNRQAVLDQPWDLVVMHGQSTLDFERPGDPAKLVRSSRELGEWLQQRHAEVGIFLLATWARADQTYPATGTWAGRSIAAMAEDVRRAYDLAATSTPNLRAVIPVGEAWTRAMEDGLADANPYDGVAAAQLNLWTYDHYHASAAGSYLEALVVFGTVTGVDPLSFGSGECAGFELGFSAQQTVALQQVASATLAGEGLSLHPVSGGLVDDKPKPCAALLP
jgi:hypothetical protein